MSEKDQIWIGLKIKQNDLQWEDHTPVNYFNFNSLLRGMHRTIHVRFSSVVLDWMIKMCVIKI